MFTSVKSPSEIESMRRAGQILGSTLSHLSDVIRSGMTTKELALVAAQKIKSEQANPAFLGYNGFPDVICISVNEEVVHGIPSDRVIKKGDLVSMDLGVEVDGMIVDGAISVLVEDNNQEKEKLIKATKKSLHEGLKAVKDGCQVSDISKKIHISLESGGYGIVRDLVGHGVGHNIHEEPDIPNFFSGESKAKLVAGMTIAIEPMATLGSPDIYIDQDGWTVKTQDNSLAAHFEHTVLITQSGCEILTISK